MLGVFCKAICEDTRHVSFQAGLRCPPVFNTSLFGGVADHVNMDQNLYRLFPAPCWYLLWRIPFYLFKCMDSADAEYSVLHWILYVLSVHVSSKNWIHDLSIDSTMRTSMSLIKWPQAVYRAYCIFLFPVMYPVLVYLFYIANKQKF